MTFTSLDVHQTWYFTETAPRKKRRASTPTVYGFHRLTKSFDTVSLYNILKMLGCPETLLSILVAFYENIKARFQFDSSMSKTFPICRGSKQCFVLTPTLFDIFFSALLAHAFQEEDGIVLHTHSTGGLFNLSRLCAKTKIMHVLYSLTAVCL